MGIFYMAVRSFHLHRWSADSGLRQSTYPDKCVRASAVPPPHHAEVPGFSERVVVIIYF